MITSAPAPALDRPAVLLVDDAKIVLRLVEKALSDAGFALRVTVDRHLVDADGLDIIKDIRRRQPGCACMVITAYPSLDSAVDALRTGVVDYIQKPSADFYRIVDRVQNAIRVHRARDSQVSVEASWAGREELLREAEKIVEAIRAAQVQIKPRGRAAWNRALAEAEAHVASLRARR